MVDQRSSGNHAKFDQHMIKSPETLQLFDLTEPSFAHRRFDHRLTGASAVIIARASNVDSITPAILVYSMSTGIAIKSFMRISVPS
jgi:hypothetical protein